MGGAESLYQPVKPDENRRLNLSNRVTRKEYLQHCKNQGPGLTYLPMPAAINVGGDSPTITPALLVESFSATFHAIEEVPRDLPMHIPHLTSLDLSHNRLRLLPASIALLLHLHTARFSHNQLEGLPNSIACLAHLRLLDVSHNRLTRLPEGLGQMKSLARLNVSHNALGKLPRSLGRSTTLMVCLASHNPSITFPSREVCDKGSEATLQALRKAVDFTDAKLREAMSPRNDFPRQRGQFITNSIGVTTTAHAQLLETWYAQTQAFPDRVKCPLIAPQGSSTYGAMEMRDKVLGLVYGAAIGDALGVACEGMPKDHAAFYYGCHGEELAYDNILRDSFRTRWTPGDWTTNFDQLVLCLDSLIDWTGVVDELDFAKRLRTWSLRGFPELGDYEGYAFSLLQTKVTGDVDFLQNPHEIARRVGAALSDSKEEKYKESSWDDSAMARSLVQGIPHFHNTEEVIDNAARICCATHADPRCTLSSGFISVLIASILQGKVTSKETLAEHLPRLVDSLQASSCCEHIDVLKQFKDLVFSEVVPEHLREGKSVFRATAKVLRIVKNHDRFKEAVTEAVMDAEHCSVVSTLVGGIMGCLQGYSSLPSDWLSGLLPQQTTWLNAKLNHMLDMMGIP